MLRMLLILELQYPEKILFNINSIPILDTVSGLLQCLVFVQT